MFNKHDGGKGDKPILPQDQEAFDNNWDRIFKAKKQKEQYPCEVVRPTSNDVEVSLKVDANNDEQKAIVQVKIPF
jgi:hypothetical protein